MMGLTDYNALFSDYLPAGRTIDTARGSAQVTESAASMTGVPGADDAPLGAGRHGQSPTTPSLPNTPKASDWQRVRPMRAFAQLATSLDAELDAGRFERMQDAAIVGRVSARIAAVSERRSGLGSASVRMPTHRPGFTVEAKADLRLTCQSCGESFAHVLSTLSTLWVARDERELLAWEQGAARADVDAEGEDGGPSAHRAAELEIVLADEQASALCLVEDELLLAVPVVPRCPACAASSEPQRFSFG